TKPRGSKAKTSSIKWVRYIATNPPMFPKNCSKIILVILYLMGAARNWAVPFTNRLLANNLPNPVMYNNLKKRFMVLYFDSEQKAKVEWALQALRQTILVADYTHTFVTLALELGWEVHHSKFDVKLCQVI
ncbi:uncharacterized protein VP01_8282g1, partial [Puccinia sorghi]